MRAEVSGKAILVVDDDARVRTTLRRCLETDGYRVTEAADITKAQEILRSQLPDLVTLDLNLGKEDGLDLAREIRRGRNIPIIMVTGKGDVIDRVVGLELGADDYITKPFRVREVLARVRSVLRRAEDKAPAQVQDHQTVQDGVIMTIDGMMIDLDRMEVIDRDDRLCDVTTADIKLLRAFLENPLRPLSRDRLMDLIDGPNWSPLDRTIDNQVARLRKKIERDPANPELIRTVRGTGYLLSEKPETSLRNADTRSA